MTNDDAGAAQGDDGKLLGWELDGGSSASDGNVGGGDGDAAAMATATSKLTSGMSDARHATVGACVLHGFAGGGGGESGDGGGGGGVPSPMDQVIREWT